jgi:hypothetical protein
MFEHNELVELIISRTTELANILYNRDPNGTCGETDFETRDDDTLLVQFEEYWCGELNMDNYRLPLEFVFNEDYRKNYKTLIEKERYEKEQLKLQKLIKKKEKKLKIQEEYDILKLLCLQHLQKKYED